MAQRRVREAARQLARLVEAESDAAFDDDAVARVVSWTYPERIARRRAGQSSAKEITYLCEDGGEARLAAHDSLAQSEWLAIAHWDPGPPRKVRLAAALKESELLRDHAERIRSERVVHWDPQAEAVVET